MVKFGCLAPQSGIERRVAMAMDRHPKRGDAVKIGAPLAVVEQAAFGLFNDQGRVLQPILHLGEGVPDMGLVVLDKSLRIGALGHGKHFSDLL